MCDAQASSGIQARWKSGSLKMKYMMADCARSCDIVRQLSWHERKSSSCQVAVNLIFCVHIIMSRSDRMKSLANAPRAKNSGSFLPTFFNHIRVLALGVEPERGIAEYFTGDAPYTAVLNRLANAQLQRINPSYILRVKGKYKLRSNMTDRVPAAWPPHPVLR